MTAEESLNIMFCIWYNQLTYRVGKSSVLVKLTNDADVASGSIDVEPPVNVRGSGRLQIKTVLDLAGIALSCHYIQAYSTLV